MAVRTLQSSVLERAKAWDAQRKKDKPVYNIQTSYGSRPVYQDEFNKLVSARRTELAEEKKQQRQDEMAEHGITQPGAVAVFNAHKDMEDYKQALQRAGLRAGIEDTLKQVNQTGKLAYNPTEVKLRTGLNKDAQAGLQAKIDNENDIINNQGRKENDPAVITAKKNLKELQDRLTETQRQANEIPKMGTAHWPAPSRMYTREEEEKINHIQSRLEKGKTKNQDVQLVMADWAKQMALGRNYSNITNEQEYVQWLNQAADAGVMTPEEKKNAKKYAYMYNAPDIKNSRAYSQYIQDGIEQGIFDDEDEITMWSTKKLNADLADLIARRDQDQTNRMNNGEINAELYKKMLDRDRLEILATGEIPSVWEGNAPAEEFLDVIRSGKKPADYDKYSDQYDAWMYDFIYGDNAWNREFINGTEEESDRAYERVEELWNRFENGTISDLADSYNDEIGNLQDKAYTHETNLDRQIKAYQDELNRRETVTKYGGNLQGQQYDPSLLGEDLELQYGDNLFGNRSANGENDMDYMYFYINRVAGTEQDRGDGMIGELTEVQDAENPYAKYSFMDYEQVAKFNELYNSGQKEAARAYLQALDPYLSQMARGRAEELRYNASKGQYGGWYGLGTIFRQPVAGLMGTVGTVVSLMGNEDAKNPNSNWYKLQKMNDTTRGARAESWGDFFADNFGEEYRATGEWLNGLTYSIADNIMAMAIAKGTGLTFNYNMSSKAAERVIQFVMSSGATATEMVNRLESGMDPTEAAIRAIGKGFIEAITEKYSIEAMLKPDVKDMLGNWKKVGVLLAKNTFAEGSEEGASDILSTIWDEMLSGIYGHESDLKQEYNALIANGMSEEEASRQVLNNWMEQLGSDVLAGALSGFVLSGGRVALNSLEQQVTGSKINSQGNETAGKSGVEQLIEAAKGMSADTESRQLAEQLYEKTKKGKKVSNSEAGRLAQNIAYETNEQVGEIAKGTVEQLVADTMKENGATGDQIAATAGIIAEAVVNNKKLTKEQLSTVAQVKQAVEAYRDFMTDEGQMVASMVVNAEPEVQTAKSVQETVSKLITGESAAIISRKLSKDVIESAKKAKLATEDDIAEAEGKRSKTGTDVIVDNEIVQVTGKSGNSYQILKADGTAATVGATAVQPIDLQIGTLMGFSEKNSNILGEKGFNAITAGIADNRKIAAGRYMEEALKVYMAARTQGEMPTTSINKGTAESIWNAAQEENQTESEKRMASGQLEVTPGKGTATFDGTEYGTKEWKNQIKNLSKQQRNQMGAVAEYAKRIGLHVEFINDPENRKIFGSEDKETGTITLNIAGKEADMRFGGKVILGGNHHLLVVAAHEFTHWLEQNSMDSYNELRQFVFNKLRAKGQNVEDLVLSKIDAYRAVTKQELTIEDAMAEIVADACDQVLGNEQVAKELQKVNPNLYDKTRSFVKNMVARISEAVAGMESSASYEARLLMDYRDELSRIWLGTMKEAQAGREGRTGTADANAGVQLSLRLGDYQFAKDVKNDLNLFVKDNAAFKQKFGNDDFVFGRTPAALIAIDIADKPFVMDQRHLDSLLVHFKDADHKMTAQDLMEIINKSNDPVAIIKSKTRPHNSVVMIVDHEINGHVVVVPVEISTTGNANRVRIDINRMSSAYGKNGLSLILQDAIETELNGKEPGIYYTNKNKADYLRGKGLQLPSGTKNNGLIHKITDNANFVNQKDQHPQNTELLMNNLKGKKSVYQQRDVDVSAWKRYQMRDGELYMMDNNDNETRLTGLDREYVEAWWNHDWARMEEILADKIRENGAIPFKTPNAYTSPSHQWVANAIKTGNTMAIGQAAQEMAQLVPDNAVLVPMPNHHGQTTDDTDTVVLAEAISKITGRPVIRALAGVERESRKADKAKPKSKQMKAADLGFRQVAEIPEGTVPYFVDNVIASGLTAEAAHRALGNNGVTLAYAKSTRSANDGLKRANVTFYDTSKQYGSYLIPLSERIDMSRKGYAGTKFSVQQMDDAYMAAVNAGDMATANRMVMEKAKEAGVFLNKRGWPLKLYHGTGRFGFTVFDTSRTKWNVGALFTTSSRAVASGYSEFGDERGASSKYIEDDGTDATLIKNAKNVLNTEYRRLSQDDVNRIREKLLKDFRKQAEAENEAMNNNQDYYPPDEINLEFWDVVQALDHIVEEDQWFFDEDSEWAKNYIERNELPNYYEEWRKLREYYDNNEEEYRRLKEDGNGYYQLLLNSYEHSDTLADAEYTYKRLLHADDMFIRADSDNIVSRDSLQEHIETLKGKGTYTLYGMPGDNPLEIDAEKSFWTGIKAPMIGEGYYSTDSIVKWAKENGYTSVVIKNVMDPGVVNEYGDDYVFFDASQLKSADTVTYDDNGEVIPLSERFNPDQKDIRYSVQQMEKTYESLNVSPDVYFRGTMDQINAAEAAEAARAEELRKLIDTNEFMALEFMKPDGRREILHRSSRPGVRYQLSYIGSDGEPTMHESYGRIEGENAGNESVHSMEELYDHFVRENLRSDLNISVMEDRNEEKDTRRYSIDQGDMNVQVWLQGLTESSLSTAQEKTMLRQYQDLKKGLDVMRGLNEERRRKLEKLLAKPNPSAYDRKQIRDLQSVMQAKQREIDRQEEKLAKVTGDKGFARLMYTQAKIMEDLVNGRTADDVRHTVDAISRELEAVKKEMAERSEQLKTLAAKEAVIRIRQQLNSAGLKRIAAKLKTDLNSNLSNTEIENRLALMALKMKEGKVDSDEVTELADMLIGKMNPAYDSYVLETLRGRTITLNKNQLAELKGQNRTVREIQQELAGTGIRIRTTDGNTLDQNWDELCDLLPQLNREASDADMLDNLLDLVASERRAARAEGANNDQVAAMVVTAAADLIPEIVTDKKSMQLIRETLKYIAEMSRQAGETAKAMEELNSLMDRLQAKGRQAKSTLGTLENKIHDAIEYNNKLTEQSEAATWKEERRKLINSLNSEHAQAMIAQQQEFRERIEKDRKARNTQAENAALRRRINTNITRVRALLMRESAQKNIPEHMKPIARHMLEKIVNNDLVGRKISGISREDLQETKRVLDAWKAQDGEYNPDSLKGLDDAVQDALYNAVEDLISGIEYYNESAKGHSLQENLDRYNGALTEISNAVSTITGIINAERTISLGDRRVLLDDMAYKVQESTGGRRAKEFTGRAGLAIANLRKAVVSGNLTPEYFFRTLKNAGLDDLWEEYHRAENRNGLELMKAQTKLDEIAKKYGYKNWDMDKRLTVKLDSGDVSMTLGQIMSLYATWKREHTLGPAMSNHLQMGGFYVEENDPRQGFLGRRVVDLRAHRVNEQDMQLVQSLMTDEQQKFVDEIVSYMSNEMSELGNEASMKAYGIKMYKESYYFPFKMWDGIKARASNDSGSAAAANERAFHPSFSKTRLHGANNAVMIGDFMTTAADHIVGMINYATMGLANENLQRVLNKQVPEGDRLDTMTKRTIRTVLQEAYGKEATDYMAKLQEQLNGGVSRMDRTLYDRALTLFRKNAVAGSMSVALQQPLSYIRAAMMINPKYLAGALSPVYWRGSFKEMMAHSGVAVIKKMGRFDMGFGAGAREFISPEGKEGRVRQAWDAVTEKATILPELMDQMTWTRMWSAVKMEQHALHPEMDVHSDAFLDMVGERFNDVMRKTQVYDSTLTKSQNMRSQNPFVKSITSFMAEPTLTLNVLADAARNAGEKGGKVRLAKALATFALSAAAQAAVKAIMSSGRSPDDKKTWYENFEYRFWTNLIQEADVANLVPGYNDLIMLLKNGKLDDDAMGAIGKIFTAFEKMTQVASPDKINDYRAWEDGPAQIIQLFSQLPAKNIMRDLRAMYNWFIGKPYAQREDSAAVLKLQRDAVAMNADNLLGVIVAKLGEAGYKTTNNAYYGRMFQAMQRGDQAEADQIREYLELAKGVDDKKIESGLRSQARDNLAPAESSQWMIDNDLMDGTGTITTQYKEGDITADEARKLYKAADPELSDDDIWWKIDRADYQKETGETKTGYYYRLGPALETNRSEQINAVIKDLLKHGRTKEQVKTQINTELKQKYLEADNSGRVRIRDEMQKAYKAAGYTVDDANKQIEKWKKDAEKKK